MTRFHAAHACAIVLLSVAGCGGNPQLLPIGSPCVSSSQCGSDTKFFCDKDHPGGYCKKDCTTDADCPAEAICAHSGGVGACHKKCDADKDCRDSEGYVCLPASTTGDELASHAFCDQEEAPVLPHTLFVAHEGTLVSYDLSTGMERPGTVTNVTGPTDLQSLDNGTLLVDLSGRSEILAVDGFTMLEKARVKSSDAGGLRPVHSYITAIRNMKQYYIGLNDGTGMAATNSARFVDIVPASPTYLKAVGEVSLGIGHHKAALSSTTERIVVSNIGDCDNVLSVYDYSDVTQIKSLATLTAKQAGWDGMSFPKTCDPTFQMGVPPSPHGCATSKASGKAYCNLTASGDIVVVDIDATPPTFTLLATHGSGGGYTRASDDGKYVYSLQETPREGDMNRPGAKCQAGQLVVIDAAGGTIAKEVPLLYKGPTCTDSLLTTDEETAYPGHIQISKDGKTLFAMTAGGFGVATARVRQLLVVDLADPASPVQKASIQVGTSTSHVGDTISGDGKWFFTADNVDGTVTQVEVATLKVARTIKVGMKPLTVATFGTAEGPSHQTGPIP